MKYAWVHQHANTWPSAWCCSALGVSFSGYKAWQTGGRCEKRLTEPQLLTLIRTAHEQSKGAYGAPRIYREIKSQGLPASKDRVARLMREHGIRARHKRRYKVTTDSKHSLPVAPNELNRDFTPQRPDQTWTADLTYIPTKQGWLNRPGFSGGHLV